MAFCTNDGSQFWALSLKSSNKHIIESQKKGLDINTTIYPFKVLLPDNLLLDVEDWNDAENYVTTAIYLLSLSFLAKNLPILLTGNMR